MLEAYTTAARCLSAFVFKLWQNYLIYWTFGWAKQAGEWAVLANASVALALSVPTPMLQLGVYDVSAS